VAAYRDAFVLFLNFAQKRLNKPPTAFLLTDITPSLILAFLDHLEVDRGGHGQPRIHDLRHSFAVKRLTLWHEQDIDLNQRMLALSTYMGHVKISHTYWYLTGVPELMALAGARFESFACAGEFDHE